MAEIIISINPTAGFTKQLRDGVKKQLPDVVFDRVLVKRSSITRAIGDYLVEVFNSTEVAQALRGNNPTDLPAEFGLTDSQAVELADGMAGIIRKSVVIRRGNPNSSVVIGISAIQADWDEYRALPGGEYESHSKRGTFLIPVAYWMLVDPNVDAITVEYEIVYNGPGVEVHSRSGRALMFRQTTVEKLGLHGKGPYLLPAIVQKRAGQNFIEYTLGQEAVAETAMGILFENL